MVLDKLKSRGKAGSGDGPAEPATNPPEGGASTLVTAPVQGAQESEKIGPGPGVIPKGPATTHYRYQHVILPAGPGGDVVPGPETAALTACIAAGYRPVGEPTLEPVADHPDGVSKVVTWSIPAVGASDPAWREEA